MAQMEIENDNDLREWLDSQPREVSVAIAARAAQRAIIIAFPSLDAGDEGHRSIILLDTCRAMAASWAAAINPTQSAEQPEAFHAAAQNASKVYAEASFGSTYAAAHAACETAALAANASIRVNAATEAAYAAEGAAITAEAADIDPKSVWRETFKDADFIAASDPATAASDLCERRLFSTGTGQMYAEWNAFARELADRKEVKDPHTGATRVVDKEEGERRNGEAWHVWTDWIDDRIKGKPSIEALEVERVLIPEEDWEKGPHHVNHLIARMISRHESAARPSVKTVNIAPDSGALRQTPAEAAPTLPDDLSVEQVILSSRTTILELMAFHRAQNSWQQYSILEFEFGLLRAALDASPLDVAQVFDACDGAVTTIDDLVLDASLADGTETKRLKRILLQAMERLASHYPSLQATRVARSQTAPAPMSPDEIDAARRAVAALQDILEDGFRTELEAEIDTIDLREDRLPTGAKLDRVDRNARRRLAEDLLQIRRIGYEDIDELLSNVDERVDKARKAEAYREAFRELDDIWLELRAWFQTYFDE